MRQGMAFLHFLHLLHELFEVRAQAFDWTARQQFGLPLVQARPAATGIVPYRRHNKPSLGPLGDSLDDFAPVSEAVAADDG